MKNMKKKSILLLAMIITVLTAAVGGTLAYLIDSTDSVVNTFEPSSIPPQIIEEFDGKTTKSAIAVKNNGNVDAYIRVAIAGNWVLETNEGKVIVAPATAQEIAFTYNTTDWIQKGGYYYHKAPVGGGVTTNNLFAEDASGNTRNPIVSTPKADGSYLEVTVITQSIQAEPTSVVTTKWGVTLDAAGNIQ